jgi:carbamoyltransferase
MTVHLNWLEKFHKLFGAPPRKKEGELTQREMDLAASIQLVTEEIMINMQKKLQVVITFV